MSKKTSSTQLSVQTPTGKVQKGVGQIRRFVSVVVLGVLVVSLGLVGTAAYATHSFAPDYSWYTQNPHASTFEIRTPGQLQGLSDLVGGYADVDEDGTLDEPLDFSHKTIRLVNNVNFGGKQIYPIGTPEHPFCGTFDGNGKTIGGITLTQATAISYVGLFGFCGQDSLLKDIVLEDDCSVNITVTCDTTSDATNTSIRYVGGVVGKTQGEIQGCVSRASLTVCWDDNNAGTTRTKENAEVVSYVGGVAGCAHKDITDTRFTGSFNVSVSADAFFDTESQRLDAIVARYFGGIAGRAGGTDEDAQSGDKTRHGNLVRCSNSANINVVTSGQGGTDRFGETVESKSMYVGGIAGASIGNISQCTNTGDILATGYIKTGDKDADRKGIQASAGGGQCTGGIVGSFRGMRVSGFSGGMGTDAGMAGNGQDPLVLSECSNLGSVIGLVSVGGITGQAGTYTTITTSSNGDAARVRQNAMVGYVEGTRWNKPSVGGVAGETFGAVSFCRNHGEVTTHNIGYYIGGIVGHLNYYYNSSFQVAHPTAEVHSCYSTGQVGSMASFRRGAIVGGSEEGFVHDCLWLYGSSPRVDEIDYDPTGLGVGEDRGVTARVRLCYVSAAQAEKAQDKGGPVLTEKNATALLNKVAAVSADPSGMWQSFWIINQGINLGYPVINTNAFATGSIDLSTMGAQAHLVRNARYTTAYNPAPDVEVTIESPEGSLELVQGVDFVVIGDAEALDENDICKGVTPKGEYPYTCSIIGIGTYYGQTLGCAYGIDAGDFGECTVVATPTNYTGEAQNTPAVTVVDSAGNIVPPSEYTFVINDGLPCIKPDGYKITATALPESNYIGASEGIYTIKAIDLAKECDIIGIIYDDRVYYYDEDRGYRLYEVIPIRDEQGQLTYHEDTGFPVVEGEKEYVGDDGVSRTQATPRFTDENGEPVWGMSARYTGKDIKPYVIGVVWQGKPLDQSWWRADYGGGAGGAMDYENVLASPNIDAWSTGAITVRHLFPYTRNYVVMTFDIEPVEIAAKDLQVMPGSTTVLYNAGKRPEDPELSVLYNGIKLTPKNYTLELTGSSFDGTTWQTGEDISFAEGATLRYRVVLNKEASVFIPDITHDPDQQNLEFSVAIVGEQKNINDPSVRVEYEMIDTHHTFTGTRSPKVTVYDGDTLLVKDRDYLLWFRDDSAYNDSYFGTWRLEVRLEGLGDYTGWRKEVVEIEKTIFTEDLFIPGTAEYEEKNKGHAYINSGGPLNPYQGSTAYLPFINYGYTKDTLSTCLDLCWFPDRIPPELKGLDESTYSVFNGFIYSLYKGTMYNQFTGNGHAFKVTHIKDEQGQEVEIARECGTYYATVVKDPNFKSNLFEPADDFEYICTLTIYPLLLSYYSNPLTFDEEAELINPRVALAFLSYDQFFSSFGSSSNDIHISYDATTYPYTGHEVIPAYRIFDRTTEARLLDYFGFKNTTLEDSLIDPSQYEVTVSGFEPGGGPVESGTYEVINIHPAPGATQVCGELPWKHLLNTDQSRFSVVAADISDPDQVRIEIDSPSYTGDELTPTVHFFIGDKECAYKEGSDYAVSYTNNIEACDASADNPPLATITILDANHLVAFDSEGKFSTTVSVPFTIKEAPVSLTDDVSWHIQDTIALQEDAAGQASTNLVVPDITGTYRLKGEDTDRVVPKEVYTIEQGTLDQDGNFVAQEHGWQANDTVVWRISSTGTNPNFVGSSVLNKTSVVVRALPQASFSHANEQGSLQVLGLSPQTYTGHPLTPQPDVKNASGIPLREGHDFVCSYGTNTNASTPGSVTLTGMGSYTGTYTLSFDITPADLSDATITCAPQVYCGMPLYPQQKDISVMLCGTTLPESDWQVDPQGYGNNTSVLEGGSVTIKAGTSANTSGEVQAHFPILPLKLNKDRFAFTQNESLSYTGTPVVLDQNDISVTDTQAQQPLSFGTDFRINWPANRTFAGAAPVWVTGVGNYAGSFVAACSIDKADFSDATITSNTSSVVYSGAPQLIDTTVIWNNQNLIVGSDYALTYTNNTEVGTASISAKGLNNFEGRAEKDYQFEIVPATLTDANTTIELEQESFTYTKAPITPRVNVKLYGVTLPESDYVVTYENNTEPGQATIRITGKGANVSCDAFVTTTFTITKASISECQVKKIEDVPYLFDHQDPTCAVPLTPDLTITTKDGIALEKDKDYEVIYMQNTTLGQARATVFGKGFWKDTLSASFNIVPYPLTAQDVELSQDTFVFDGAKHIPSVTVSVLGYTLQEGKDYECVVLSDATSLGSHTLEIKALPLSVFSSSVVLSYEIVDNTPPVPSTPKVINIAGTDRYTTALACALSAYPQGAEGVVIATGENFPDALSAAGLAGVCDWPIILSAQEGLSQQAKDTIATLQAKKAYLIGGPLTLSDTVLTDAQKACGTTEVIRIAGNDRYATAEAVLDKGAQVGTWSSTCVIAAGTNFPDALAVSPYAFANRCPIVLSSPEGLSNNAQQRLADLGFSDAVIAGGPSSVPDLVPLQLADHTGITNTVRLAGNNRYETSLAIAQWIVAHTDSTWDGLGITTGKNYPDALAGSAPLGCMRTVLLLADEDNTDTLSVLKTYKDAISNLRFLGGINTVTHTVREQALDELGWPQSILRENNP